VSEANNIKAGGWYVYMVQTEKQHLYTGIAKDVLRRLREHQDAAEGKPGAKGAKFFRSQKPVEVVYTRVFTARAEALQHERYIKSLNSRQKRALVAASQNG
jgi:putative endonuclease